MIIEELLVDKIFNGALLFVIDMIATWFNFWVYFTNPKGLTNRLFFALSFSILIWVNAAYFFTFSESSIQALFWAKVGVGGVFPFLAFFYCFSTYFFSKKKEITFLNKIFIGLGVFLLFFTFLTNTIVSGSEITEWGMNIIFTFWGRIIFYGMVILVTFLSIIKLFKNYFQLSKERKLRVQYFLIGFFIFILMNVIFNVGFPLFQKTIKYWQFGNYSTLIFLGFTAYAIVKRELFGIRVVLTSLLVGLIAILLAFDALVFTENLIFQLVKGVILILFLYFGYLLINSVLTEIRRREEIERLYEELKELDKAKSEFISIASHQLRTPVSIIRGMLSMLASGELKDKLKEEFIQKSFIASNRLERLISDLLSATQLEGSKMIINLETIQIEDIIQDIIKELEPLAKERNVMLKYEKREKPPPVMVDSKGVREVISNLIDNAIRYTRRGSVTVSNERINNELTILVKDTGIGITKKEKEKLFQKLYRGPRAIQMETEGTGLGLFIVKKITEGHNGRIEVESEGEDKGSIFKLILPLSL